MFLGLRHSFEMLGLGPLSRRLPEPAKQIASDVYSMGELWDSETPSFWRNMKLGKCFAGVFFFLGFDMPIRNLHIPYASLFVLYRRLAWIKFLQVWPVLLMDCVCFEDWYYISLYTILHALLSLIRICCISCVTKSKGTKIQEKTSGQCTGIQESKYTYIHFPK